MLVLIYVVRGFSNGCALVSFFKISLESMAGVWMDGFLGTNDHSCMSFGLFTCPSL
jgi:hypothetical protein